MRLLALDLSTHLGFAVFVDGKYIKHGDHKIKVEDFNVNDHPEKSSSYPKNLISAANDIANVIVELYYENEIDQIVIENTVRGKNRNTQRLLEFLHFRVLQRLTMPPVSLSFDSIKYLDPSEWRKIVGMYMTKDDKKNNRDVSAKKKRGRITKKHLSVRMVNDMFNLDLKIKDNDAADAILLGHAFILRGKNE